MDMNEAFKQMNKDKQDSILTLFAEKEKELKQKEIITTHIEIIKKIKSAKTVEELEKLKKEVIDGDKLVLPSKLKYLIINNEPANVKQIFSVCEKCKSIGECINCSKTKAGEFCSSCNNSRLCNLCEGKGLIESNEEEKISKDKVKYSHRLIKREFRNDKNVKKCHYVNTNTKKRCDNDADQNGFCQKCNEKDVIKNYLNSK